jgi:hypothetical protein
MIAQLRRDVAMAATAALALFAITAAASAASGSQQATVQGLVGTWSCVSHTSENKTFHGTDVDTMYGKWLAIDETFPAQNGEAAGTARVFFGYDPKHSRWIVAGVDTNGAYFVNYSNSPSFDGAQWYDGYPNNHGSAVTHLKPYTQYTVDSKGPNAQGKIVTDHEVCTKQ